MENKRMRGSYDTTSVVRKGAWTAEEDTLLKNCIEKFGEGKWHLVPLRSGLNRCRKSCRLRWLNYLRPNIKRGDFAEDEVDLILRLHKLLANRWSLIAGRIPGRTANDVKNYWNTHLKSRCKQQKEQVKGGEQSPPRMVIIIKPQPHTISKVLNLHAHITSQKTHNLITSSNVDSVDNGFNISQDIVSSPELSIDKFNEYLDALLEDRVEEIGHEVGWSFDGLSVEEDGLDVVQQVDDQNSLFDFPIDDLVMLDLLD